MRGAKPLNRRILSLNLLFFSFVIQVLDVKYIITNNCNHRHLGE